VTGGRGSFLAVVALAMLVFAGAALGARAVATTVVVTDVHYSSAGKLTLGGDLKSRKEVCRRSRKVAVFKAVFDGGGDKKLGATKARHGRWEFTSHAVRPDDYVYARVRRGVEEGGRRPVTCRGGQSGDFMVHGP
jgi:hypothetical protein